LLKDTWALEYWIVSGLCPTHAAALICGIGFGKNKKKIDKNKYAKHAVSLVLPDLFLIFWALSSAVPTADSQSKLSLYFVLYNASSFGSETHLLVPRYYNFGLALKSLKNVIFFQI